MDRDSALLLVDALTDSLLAVLSWQSLLQRLFRDMCC
jgi:hypothetical protein